MRRERELVLALYTSVKEADGKLTITHSDDSLQALECIPTALVSRNSSRDIFDKLGKVSDFKELIYSDEL